MLGRYYLRNCTRQESIIIIIFMKPLTSLSFSFFFRRGQGVCVCVCVCWEGGGNYQTEWLFPNGWWLIYSCWEQPHHSRGTPVCSAEWGARCQRSVSSPAQCRCEDSGRPERSPPGPEHSVPARQPSRETACIVSMVNPDLYNPTKCGPTICEHINEWFYIKLNLFF